MYKFDGTIISDMPGSMTGSVPSPIVVADVISGLYKEACNLEAVYDLLNVEYEGENDFYAMLSDLSDAMDNVDLETLTDLRESFGTGIIYSAAERWIIPELTNLYDNSNPHNLACSIITSIKNLIDDCDYVSYEDLQVISSSLYSCIASMFNEIFNTYELGKWIKARNEELPPISDVTRGFNEFMIRMNMDIDEISDLIFSKCQKFIFVSNAVDKDPEVSKRIRAMVPDDLRFEFESIIELIDEDMIEDLLNGKVRINQEWINMVSSEDEDDGE